MGDGRDRVDELLDRAVAAINRGDRDTAASLAEQVLTTDRGNSDAEDLLAVTGESGEFRRLTILFADLVDSSRLSTQVELETYHALVARYRELVMRVVDGYGGHVASTKGDGLLAIFGHPVAHEDDLRRALLAGLEIAREVERLGERARKQFDVGVAVRVGIHRGLVYLDTVRDDVDGPAVNLAARVESLAPPGTVVVSEAVAALARNDFELQARPPAAVKGFDELVAHYRVIGERQRDRSTARRVALVGRSRELARIAKSWSRAHAGTLTTAGLVFRGEPGIGKSRLATAAAEQAEASGAPVLELTGSALHSDVGLHPVRTFLERRCGISRDTRPSERLVLLEAETAAVGLEPVTAVPLLAPILGIAAEQGYEPVPAEGQRLYELINEAAAQYVRACTRDAPALVVAEDMHWFDAATLQVIGALLAGADSRMLLVATGRPGNWCRDDWPAKVVDLKPLSDEETDELILSINPTVTEIDRAAIRSRCDGVPFFVEQVVIGLGAAGVPEGLYDSLFARFQGRADVLPVVQAAAVIGRHVDREILGAIVDLDEHTVDDVLDELDDARVLEPWEIDNWRFRHELLRELAYELAPPSVARRLHERVGRVLTESAEPDWPLVARHYEQANAFVEAASAYEMAAAKARTRGALDEARGALTAAISGLQQSPPGPERNGREVSLRMQRALLAISAEGGSSPAAMEDYERCMHLGGNDLRSDAMVAAISGLAAHYCGQGDIRRTRQAAELLLAAADEGRPWFRPAAHCALGIACTFHGEFDSARRYFDEAVADAGSLTPHDISAMWVIPYDPIAASHQQLAVVSCLRGQLVEATAHLQRSAIRSGELGFPEGPYSDLFGKSLETWICLESADFDRSALLAGAFAEEADRCGFEQIRLWGLTQQIEAHALKALSRKDMAPLPRHIEEMFAMLEAWRASNLALYITCHEATLAKLLIGVGRSNEARQRIDADLRRSDDDDMTFYNAELLRLRAATADDPEERRADLAAARELARRQGAVLFELRAAMDDFDTRGEPARATLCQAVDRMPDDSGCPELQVALMKLAGHA